MFTFSHHGDYKRASKSSYLVDGGEPINFSAKEPILFVLPLVQTLFVPFHLEIGLKESKTVILFTSGSQQVFRLDHIVMKIGERQTHFLSHDPRSRLLCETLLPRKECKIASVFYEKDQTLKPVKLFPIFMDVEVQGKVQWGFDLQNVWKKRKESYTFIFHTSKWQHKKGKVHRGFAKCLKKQ